MINVLIGWRRYEEELKQDKIKPGFFPLEIPDSIWDLSSTVVMKSEYQHGPHRQDGCLPGCFPKKLVLCTVPNLTSGATSKRLKHSLKRLGFTICIWMVSEPVS